MWRPGFPFVRSERARMNGVHRSACIYSWVHRGTQDYPGIVLGLDRGGSCLGMAFMVANTKRAEVLDYLRARELVTNVYRETTRPVRLPSGESVPCVTFVVRRNHRQYAGRLSHESLLERIRNAEGQSGPNIEYIVNTARQLETMNIRDQTMQRLLRELEV